jgi:AcrR family transcriptional regulator
MEHVRISTALANLVRPLRQAFLDFGYEQSTMVGLAKACDLTRRALYHHFSSKEEAFRFVLRYDGDMAIRLALETAHQRMVDGANAVEILTATMDARYAENRRVLAASPHALEINDQAFRRARDIMVGAAVEFQRRLAELIVEMAEKHLLTPRPSVTPEALAQMLADGARGSNQALPPVRPDELPDRYRAILGAILYGATVPMDERKTTR